MPVKQISVNLASRPGEISAMCEHLHNDGINIRAMSIADGADTATVRLITDDPPKTVNVLNSHGFTAEESEVIAVEVPEHPGGLLAIMKPLAAAGIKILHCYPFLGKGQSGLTILILGVDKTEGAAKALQSNWLRIFGQEIYTL